MTREEAVKRLKEARSTIQPFRYVDEVIDYVIKILEKEPCADAINREEAIKPFLVDATEEWTSADIVKYLKSLSPVTSAEEQESICETLTSGYVQEIKAECDDCISRQEVLDQTYLWSKDEFLRVTNPFDYLRKRINSLLSVTPTEEVAHWEYVQYDGDPNIGNWHCSKCHAIVNYEPIYNWEKKPYHKFCPNCGRKMEEL